jgi:hypothetical protein
LSSLPSSDHASPSTARLALVATLLIVVGGFIGVALVASRVVRRGEPERTNLARGFASAAERDAGVTPAETAVGDSVPGVTTGSATALGPRPSIPTSRRPARHTDACNPPYSVDADGLRHFKPECL